MTDSLREKARAFKADWNPKTDDSILAMLAAFGKEVAEEAVKNERVTISNLDRQVAHLNDRLDAFTSATPDSPEVKEAVALSDRWQGESVTGLPAESALTAAIILARALRAAQVRIKELEGTSAGIFQLEAAAAQAKLAEAEISEARTLSEYEREKENGSFQTERAEAAEAKLADQSNVIIELGAKLNATKLREEGLEAEVATLTAALRRGHTDDDGVICGQDGRHRCASCAALPPLPADAKEKP